MEKLVYVACCYPNQNNDGYKVEIPDLPGLNFEGDSIEKAMNMATSEVSGWALKSIENGKILPKPSTINDITLKNDSGFYSLISFDVGK